MPTVSNTIKVVVTGKKASAKINPNFEAVQLALINAERLFFDSRKVSTPTKMALIELGLEEVSKAIGMLLSFEKAQFDADPTLMNRFLSYSHFSKKKYTKILQEKSQFLTKFFNENNPDQFMQFFDKYSFADHAKKVQFLSKFIEYTREFTLPLIRGSSERAKLVKDMVGRYVKFGPDEFKTADKFIDKTLNIDEKQLYDITDIKNRGLYLVRVGDLFVSPSSYTFITEHAENLLVVLIAIVRNDVTAFAIAKERYRGKITAVPKEQKNRST